MTTRQEALTHDGLGNFDCQGVLTVNKELRMKDSAGTLQGFIGAPVPGFGAIFGFSDDGNYDTNDGALLVDRGGATLAGSSINFNSLIGNVQRNLQVDATGALIAVDLPDPPWDLIDTDNASYDLGTGTTVQPWVEMTGLFVTLTDAIVDTERIDFTIRVTAINKTTNRSGIIEVGLGVDGADPTTAAGSHNIPPAFNGSVSLAGNFTGVNLSIGQTLTVFGRILSGNNAQFGVDLDGSVTEHFLEVYKGGSVSVNELNSIFGASGWDTQEEAIEAIKNALYGLTGFGIMRVVDGTTAEPITDAVPRKVTAAWNDFGPSNIMVVDSGDSAIETPNEGTFAVDARLTFLNGANKIFKAEIFQFDDSISTWLPTGIADTGKLTIGNDIGVMAPAGFLALDRGDKVAVYHHSTNGGNTFTVLDGHLRLSQVND